MLGLWVRCQALSAFIPVCCSAQSEPSLMSQCLSFRLI